MKFSATLRSTRRPKSALGYRLYERYSRPAEVSRERSTLAQTARSRACSHQQVACEGRSIRAHKGPLCRYFHDGRMHASTDGYRARVPVTMYAMLSPHSCNRYRVQCAYLVCLSSIPTFDETVLRSADITTIMSSKPENNACKR